MNPRSALVADRAAATSPPHGSGPDSSDPAGSASVDSAASNGAASNGAASNGAAVDGGPPGNVVPRIPVSPERLAARRVIDHAKSLLISRQDMSEPEAYRWIQKTAMDRRSPMATIAATIIEGFEHPAPIGDEPAVDPVTDPRAATAQPVGGTG